ncbi:protein kinase domain-containing protein [Pseudarthrobacter sp. L19]|uniref:protein kinase domain-containing protein n=1 Tax=Pseudarthrobacter sp. L19 TaxID=3423951 RepID=UPI003D7975A4
MTFAQVLDDQHRAARRLHRRTPVQAPAGHAQRTARPGTCPGEASATFSLSPAATGTPAAGGHPAATGTAAVERLLDGRYLLGELLGRGSEADVYRATDLAARSSAPELAVKIFRAGTADAASPFIRERDLHGPLRQRAIVRVLGHGRAADDDATAAGRGYVVTELIDGPDLRSHLHGNTLSAGQVTVWSADIAGALAHLHRRGIVHNDVKPANIILAGLTPGHAGAGAGPR